MSLPSTEVASISAASGNSVPWTQGGTAMVASTVNERSTAGPSTSPAMSDSADVSMAEPSNSAVHVRKGSTHRKTSGPAPSTEDFPSGPVVGRRREPVSQTEHASVGERHVHLEVVPIPLRGERFDREAWEPHRAAVVGDPHVHRVPHLVRFGSLGEHVLARRVESPGQVDRHVRSSVQRAMRAV